MHIATEVESAKPKRKKIDGYSEWSDFTDEEDEVHLYLMETCFMESENILEYWESKV